MLQVIWKCLFVLIHLQIFNFKFFFFQLKKIYFCNLKKILNNYYKIMLNYLIFFFINILIVTS
jgi:hypothetical protein